jgi:hypothetical protein
MHKTQIFQNNKRLNIESSGNESGTSQPNLTTEEIKILEEMKELENRQRASLELLKRGTEANEKLHNIYEKLFNTGVPEELMQELVDSTEETNRIAHEKGLLDIGSRRLNEPLKSLNSEESGYKRTNIGFLRND